ncbi:helix-turn-helix transcriptional regulator [Ciceribacter sp. L1K23]|uniref:winged helix-turn-helix transcriptional regulator n=1 Tax=Ciceribacter sp. L1K23 TaxID=2820276 RepID=UPI001B820071|nr:helix-turn-helix domain-containing protein [Ciceribacter sp. L1K23]MBR0556289.1 helix-turn-helix transcriptional regulator [Ciceribacter sp. L1K23]
MSRPRAKLSSNFPGCPVESTLSLLDGKWKGVILFHLFKSGTLRFSELQRSLPSITQRMLTKQLRELEDNGLVERKVYPVVPPKVEYSLTRIGRSLEDVIMVLAKWGNTHVICEDGRKYVSLPDDPSSMLELPISAERSAAA